MNYEKLLDKATLAYRKCASNAEKRRLESIFPELKVKERGDTEIRKEIIAYLDVQDAVSGGKDQDFKYWISWLEKQADYNPYKETIESIAAMVERYADNGDLKDFYDNIKVKCKDAMEYDKILSEKQGEFPKPEIGNPPHEGDSDNPYDMSFEEAQRYASERGIDVPINDGDVFVDERYITQTIGNVLRWADMHPKTQKKEEPKFKVKDWVIGRATGNIPRQSKEITKDGYKTTYGGWIDSSFEEDMRLWTIEDAKDGDILSYVTDEGEVWIMSYNSLYEPYGGHVHYNALLANDVFFEKGTCCICIDNLKPATKEQREHFENAFERAIAGDWYEFKEESKNDSKNDKEMDIKDYEEYIKFTESFLDTIEISSYIKKNGKVYDTIRQIENCGPGFYKDFCEKARKEGTLPDVVEKEDPEFCEIFNVMDESDFIYYIEKRYGKPMSYEIATVTNYWAG